MLIALQLVTVASILLLSKLNTEKLLINNAYSSMEKTIAQSGDQTRAFLKPAHRLIDSLAMLAENNVVSFNDIISLEKIFFTTLTKNPNFAGIYIANDAGDFIYMLRVKPTDSNSFSGLQTKIIIHKSGSREVVFKKRHNDFTFVQKDKIADYSYEPRTRRWYELANQSDGIAWTEPYTFFTSKKLGITASKAFTNHLKKQTGVVGVDIEITELSAFLAKITGSDDNHDKFIRITDEKGKFIADSGDSAGVSLASINNVIKSESIKQTQTTQSGTFEINNNEFLFTQNSIKTIASEPNWNIFTYAKTAPFLTDIRQSENTNILIALATFCLSIIVSFFIAAETSKPVENWITQASTDNLTGLYNRHHFFNTGNAFFNKHVESNNTNHMALMILDADYFKLINDNYGHNIGDEVLKGLAKRLRDQLEPEELLARYGGEEFIILTAVKDESEALKLAKKIRSAIGNKLFKTSSGGIKVTVSVGVSLSKNAQNMSFLQFIEKADKALYESKNSGRNTISIASNDKLEAKELNDTSIDSPLSVLPNKT